MFILCLHSNLTVLPWWIDECALIFYVGETAVKYLGFIVWTLETDNAPFLVEHYLDHPLGGVDDMAVFTQLMWNRLENWFEVCTDLSIVSGFLCGHVFSYPEWCPARSPSTV